MRRVSGSSANRVISESVIIANPKLPLYAVVSIDRTTARNPTNAFHATMDHAPSFHPNAVSPGPATLPPPRTPPPAPRPAPTGLSRRLRPNLAFRRLCHRL